ncbi:MAG TPA: glucosamine-6-phosphate deaminase [Symbiobacteriaceae bacterium]
MKIEVMADYAALSERAAAIVAESIRRRPDAVLGLPTGSTPEGFYSALVRTGVSFRKVQTFNLDEYIGLRKEHSQSYYSYMRTHLFDRVDLPPQSIHIPDGMTPDVAAECRAYEAGIRQAGGLDVVVLGLGLNGHIGFNEPGTPWTSRTRRVALTDATRQANARFFGSIGAVPREAITMGIGTILEARRVILLASGESKADIVRRTVAEAPSEAVPATALQRHENVTILLDRAAAAEVPQVAFRSER